MARRCFGPRRQECACSCRTGGCGTHGELQPERRALTHRRLDPNAPAMHFDNLSRNGKTQARAALGARVRAVDLAEFLEYPLAFFRWDAGAGIADAQLKVAVGCSSCDAHLAGIGKFDGVAY